MRILCPLLIGILFLSHGTAQADMFKPSANEQIKLGQRVAQQVRKDEKVLPDTDPRVKYIRELGAKLISNAPDGPKDPKWQYSFDVIDSKEVNAFALPGGPMFFYTGLLEKMKTEDQIVSVIGHELIHVRKQHWASAYARQQQNALGITALLWVLGANKTAADIASISNELVLNLPFGRKQETESDDGGFDMMVKSGYNPQGMADTFLILKEVSKGGKPPEILSTHPDDGKRAARITDKIKKEGKVYPAQIQQPYYKPAKPAEQPKSTSGGGILKFRTCSCH